MQTAVTINAGTGLSPNRQLHCFHITAGNPSDKCKRAVHLSSSSGYRLNPFVNHATLGFTMSKPQRQYSTCIQAAVASTASTAAANVIASSHAPVWANILFGHLTVIMVFMYAALVFAPKNPIVSRMTRSTKLLFALGITYAITLGIAMANGLPAILATIWQQLTTNSPPNVGAVGLLFSNPIVTVTAWTHLLMLDFYQAREIWLDGLLNGVATSHSVALCFFVGPLGVLSHVITRHFTLSKSQPVASTA